MTSVPKNNLEEQLQWLANNRSSALRSGFSYALSRFDNADGVENRRVNPIFPIYTRDESHKIVQKQISDLQLERTPHAGFADMDLEALKNVRFEQLCHNKKAPEKRRETIFGDLPNEFNAPNQSMSLFGRDAVKREETQRLTAVRQEAPPSTESNAEGPSSRPVSNQQHAGAVHAGNPVSARRESMNVEPIDEFDDEDAFLASIDVDSIVAQHQQQKSSQDERHSQNDRSAPTNSGCPQPPQHFQNRRITAMQQDERNEAQSVQMLSPKELRRQQLKRQQEEVERELRKLEEAEDEMDIEDLVPCSGVTVARQPQSASDAGAGFAGFSQAEGSRCNALAGSPGSRSFEEPRDYRGPSSQHAAPSHGFQMEGSSSHGPGASPSFDGASAGGGYSSSYGGDGFSGHYAGDGYSSSYGASWSGQDLGGGQGAASGPLEPAQMDDGGYNQEDPALFNRIDLYGPDNKFPWTQNLRELNRKQFGNRTFRKHQEAIINAAMEKKDTFVLMPTGGGKSLCYQLPALLEQGITIVISPLVSLMQDQVFNLEMHRVGAMCLNASTPFSDQETAFESLRGESRNIKLLYITPEKFANSERMRREMQRAYAAGTLARIVVDEVHCVSEWGHDFRPDYKALGRLKEYFPAVPLMALTATAKPQVRLDIRRILKIEGAHMFLQSFNRANLRYEVRKKEKKKSAENIIEFIQRNHPRKTGIVYCIGKNRCEEVAERLRAEGVRALPYHAGLSEATRRENQHSWSNDETHVIVATIAFGMGINKPDVRFVIHESIPKSMEGYYQESGRAGRDGQLSHCILFYSYGDKVTHDRMAQEDYERKAPTVRGAQLQELRSQRDRLRENLSCMVGYCESQYECRRAMQMQYFGEHFAEHKCGGTCDNCAAGRTGRGEPRDVTEESRALVQIVRSVGGDKPMGLLVKIFRGSAERAAQAYASVDGYAKGKHLSISDAERLYRALVCQHMLDEKVFANPQFGGTTTHVTEGPKSAALLAGRERVELKFEEKVAKPRKEKPPKRTPATKSKGSRKKAAKVVELVDSSDEELQPVDAGGASSAGGSLISEELQRLLCGRLEGVRRGLMEELAGQRQAPPRADLIFTKDQMATMARRLPASTRHLARCLESNCVHRVRRFGEPFVAAIAAFCDEHAILRPPPDPDSAPESDAEVEELSPPVASTPSHPPPAAASLVTSTFFSDAPSVAGKRPRGDSSGGGAGAGAEGRAGVESEEDDDFVSVARPSKRARGSLALAPVPAPSPRGRRAPALFAGFIRRVWREYSEMEVGGGTRPLPEATLQVTELTTRAPAAAGGAASGGQVRVALSDGAKSHNAVVNREESKRAEVAALAVGDVVRLTAHKLYRPKSGFTWIIDSLSLVDKGAPIIGDPSPPASVSAHPIPSQSP